MTVRALHTLILLEHRARLTLVKVDVEGNEDDVLRGLEPLFEEGARPKLIVEVHASSNPDAPAYVADFCERHRLRASWLVEDQAGDRYLAPVDRQLALHDLGNPPDLGSIPRDRYALVLERRARAVR